ncbi:MAG: PEGA domain-containing protein [Myxococcales bacterium]|nr:PEGA domain-containing protein [Myxococcales bacterium]
MKRPIPFGKYYLLERINVGGMAEVFRAKAYGVEGFERLLAVKRILPNIAEDEEFIEMFIDEAKIAVQLNHANIAQIFDLGKVDDSYFIALEYIHGKDLRAIFDRCRSLSQPMPIPQACFIIMKVCEGLDYAHNKRDSSGSEMHLVHRDVSPQNVLISYEGEVKLVDFGIAKAAGKASKTQAGILKGKFGYMSPEQVRGLPLDRRSDIFSVGIVLYELLTGERLFLGESDFSTLEKVRNVEILPPSTYNRKIGEELEQIVLKALAKDVEDRYQNAIDLHDDLQAYMYSSGEFYSRKDLASWQKQTFAREIEDESKKLEAYRQMPVPEPVEAENSGPVQAAVTASVQTSPPPPPVPGTASHATYTPPPPPQPMGGNGHTGGHSDELSLPRQARSVDFPDGSDPSIVPTASQRPAGGGLSWDDEEVETQIYDKPGPNADDVVPMPMEVASAGGASMGGGGLATVSTGGGGGGLMARGDPSNAALTSPALGQTADYTPGMSMPRMPALAPAPSGEALVAPPTRTAPPRRKSRAPLFIIVSLLVLGICGAALWYFFIFSNQPGAIAISAVPSGASVYVDGKLQAGETPLTVKDLHPAYYIISVRKKGYENWEKTIEVKPGVTTSLTPQLDILATASIELRTKPGGGVASLDGRSLKGKTPMKITQIAPGRHRLEVRRGDKYHPLIHEFDIKPDQTLKLSFKLLPLEVAVKITSEPNGEAYVVRDGNRERLGRTPIDVKLNPKNSYQVVVKRDGYDEWQTDVRFDGDQPVEIKAKLERKGRSSKPPINKPPTKTTIKKPPVIVKKPPIKKPPVIVKKPPIKKPPAKKLITGIGTLRIASRPSTSISIDGRDTGLFTPQLRIPLPSGKHRVRLRNAKFNVDKTFTVFIRPKQATKLIKNFLP